ncbi:MAG: nucleolar RNA-binding Nop10p family protein [Candidatus Nanohaloarchaea archaeon]
MIRKCAECGSYTLEQEHCGEETESARPPKFSFPDRYGKYRRKTKKDVKND